MELIFLRKTGGCFFKEWNGGDVHTKDGILSAKDVKKQGVIKTVKGMEYLVMEPTLRDRIQYMRKGARPIYEYDAGLMAALLGIDKNSVVLEAGTGSACTTLILANTAKKVETYEKEERFYTIAKDNIEKAGFKNVKIHNKSLLDAKLGKYDAILLDLQNPVAAVEKVASHLKTGKFIGIFTPILDDIKPLVEKLEEKGFSETRVIQLDLKEIEVKKYVRVKGLFGFPGFVIVARKF